MLTATAYPKSKTLSLLFAKILTIIGLIRSLIPNIPNTIANWLKKTHT